MYLDMYHVSMIWEGTIMICSKTADLRAYETGQYEVQKVGDKLCWGESGKQEGYHHENLHCLSSRCDHGLRGHNFIAELSDSHST